MTSIRPRARYGLVEATGSEHDRLTGACGKARSGLK